MEYVSFCARILSFNRSLRFMHVILLFSLFHFKNVLQFAYPFTIMFPVTGFYAESYEHFV